MKFFSILLILLANTVWSFAFQSRPTQVAEGQILVQLKEGIPVSELHESWKNDLGGSEAIFSAYEISAHNRIWLLEFDTTVFSTSRFLDMAFSRNEIEVAQFNHQVFLRDTIPNDPQFPQQWQYINNGQQGGLADADIDAEQAWEITTGGLSPGGDTIVVAVIDDGFDWDHPDFTGNIWYNQDEIPGNGIDDDNNGYIDDYQGWSTNTNSGSFNGGGHGTPVAGIVGARGNNALGVSGVNWEVKLMIVQGGTGFESEVIQAYSYVLEQRIRYNETDGAEGAFVVATNASWGVDFGQPDNAPLWCAFYDTLGTHGILNCGATINGNYDVDIIGDLPTACPSDFMISVTNMNRSDQKVTSAGYGVSTIDLGAFGADTWTTASNGSYGSFGGTSGATPHVTGTIGLIYSVACPGFIQLSMEAPEQAALLARSFILDGVDPNPWLEDITSTGGRLNLFKTLQLAEDNCLVASDCLQPFNASIQSMAGSEATISWGTSSSSQQTILRYRETGSTSWTVDSTSNATYSFTGLEVCSSYEVEFQSQCAADTSQFVTALEFTTNGCCVNPEITLSAFDDYSISLYWDSILVNTDYQLRYKLPGSLDWTVLTIEDSTDVTIENLSPCTEYEIAIRSVCLPEESWSETYNFSTACGNCTSEDYCEAFGEDTSFEYIESISIGEVDLVSGPSSGLQQFFSDPLVLYTDSVYQISITPGFGEGDPADEFYKVWIDVNQDGIFQANEVFFTNDTPSSEVVSGQFSLPDTLNPGITRMRAMIRWADSGLPEPCGSFQYGEVEDYCVDIRNPITTSVRENNHTRIQLSVSPNPFSDKIFIKIYLTHPEEIIATLIDPSGTKVTNWEIGRLASGEHLLESPILNHLPSGVYFLEFRGLGFQKTIKLIHTE